MQLAIISLCNGKHGKGENPEPWTMIRPHGSGLSFSGGDHEHGRSH